MFTDFPCPQCGADVYDNRQDKRTARSPDYRCSNQDCDAGDGKPWRDWEKKKSGGGGRSGGGGGQRSGGGGQAARPPKLVRPLGELYRQSLIQANAALDELAPEATPADRVAAAATIFIAAQKSGEPLTKQVRKDPAPAPVQRAPARPAPAQRPEPKDDFEEFPGALEDEDDDLPF